MNSISVFLAINVEEKEKQEYPSIIGDFSVTAGRTVSLRFLPTCLVQNRVPPCHYVFRNKLDVMTSNLAFNRFEPLMQGVPIQGCGKTD